MNLALVAPEKTGCGRASDEVEAVLQELDLMHAVLDEWANLESFRASLSEPLNMSSTFMLIQERFEAVDSAFRRVLRPE